MNRIVFAARVFGWSLMAAIVSFTLTSAALH